MIFQIFHDKIILPKAHANDIEHDACVLLINISAFDVMSLSIVCVTFVYKVNE